MTFSICLFICLTLSPVNTLPPCSFEPVSGSSKRWRPTKVQVIGQTSRPRRQIRTNQHLRLWSSSTEIIFLNNPRRLDTDPTRTIRVQPRPPRGMVCRCHYRDDPEGGRSRCNGRVGGRGDGELVGWVRTWQETTDRHVPQRQCGNRSHGSSDRDKGSLNERSRSPLGTTGTSVSSVL